MLRRSSLFRAARNEQPTTHECILKVHHDSRIARLTLHRPQRGNAIGHTLLSELHAVLRYCHASTRLSCLIVESDVPRIFCSGADLKERHAMIVEENGVTDVEATEQYIGSLRDAFSRLEALPFPTISAIEGTALGGGLELALATDIRLAGAGATFGFPETSLGIMPGAGGTVRATALLGKSATLEMIYTTTRLTASQACEKGLVNRVVAPGTAAAAATLLAEQIVQNSPFALRVAKAAVCGAADAIAAGSDPSLRMKREEDLYRQLLTSPDRAEGVAAFVEKRRPIFTT